MNPRLKAAAAEVVALTLEAIAARVEYAAEVAATLAERLDLDEPTEALPTMSAWLGGGEHVKPSDHFRHVHVNAAPVDIHRPHVDPCPVDGCQALLNHTGAHRDSAGELIALEIVLNGYTETFEEPLKVSTDGADDTGTPTERLDP